MWANREIARLINRPADQTDRNGESPRRRVLLVVSIISYQWPTHRPAPPRPAKICEGVEHVATLW